MARRARIALRPGIIAAAKVEGPVFRGTDESDAKTFRKDLALPESRDRVWLKITGHADGRGIVRREWLMADPICHDMVILGRPADTNIATKPEHAKRLAKLWQNAGKQISRPEMIAILECWMTVRSADPGAGKRFTRAARAPHLLNRQTRMVINKTISDTAVLIGRPVGSVKLAIAKLQAIAPEGNSGKGLKGAKTEEEDNSSRNYEKLSSAEKEELLSLAEQMKTLSNELTQELAA